MMKAEIIGLFVGKAENRWPGKPPSAIAKRPHQGPLTIEAHGFIDDQQADLTVHDGAEKALHHYASEHIEFWQQTFPEHREQFKPGCFGENIATAGMTEQTLCLGDILSLGTARVQICQGRQPCWKLNLHTGIERMAAQFQKTTRTGWYYRVIENGSVKVGDTMELLERLHPDWPLERLIKARFDPRFDIASAAELTSIPALSESWCTAFAKKAKPGFVENTAPRLAGE